MKFNAALIQHFQSGSRTYMLHCNQSKNPVRYSLDMTGHEIVGKNHYLKREGYYPYLINYTVRGSGSITYNNSTFIVREGDLLFIDCNLAHLVTTEEADWEFYFVHFTGPAASDFYNQFCELTGGNVLHGFQPQQFLQEIWILHSILQSHPELLDRQNDLPADEAILTQFSSHVYAILNDIWLQLQSLPQGMPSSVQQAQKYIHENFTRKISLAEIAAAVYLSPWRLAHLFKKYTGMTVGEAITEERIRKAAILFATTNKKIIDIALECGFSDTQMLKKHIKKNFSMTPTEYRNYIRSKGMEP